MVNDKGVEPIQRHIRYTSAAAIFGALTLILAIAILWIMPGTAELGPGWKTPIIAFELARTELDLTWLVGPSARGLRDAIDLGHLVDMPFPFAYVGLLFVTFTQCTRRHALYAFAAIVSVLTIGADLSENFILLKITESYEAGKSAAVFLPELMWATWVKWLGIGILGLLISFARWPEQKLSAALAGLVGCTTIVAAVCKSPSTGEWMSLSVTLMCAVFAVHAVVTYLRRVVFVSSS